MPERPLTSFDRRKLLTRGGLLAAGVAGLSLVGCGDDSSDNGSVTPGGTGTAPGGATGTAAPKSGGTLNAAQVADISFNTGYPFVGTAENTYIEQLPVEPLVRYRDSLDPEPWLVDVYELSDDGLSLKARLKENLKFHNGDPVTPEDVFLGIEVITDPAKFGITGAFQLVNFAKAVSKMTKVDDRTMQFTFNEALPNIHDLFATLAVTQRSSFDNLKAGKDVQGTGPYKFSSWQPNTSFSFEANNDWHMKEKEGGPYLDKIQVKVFADADAIGLAYQAGDIDLILGANATTAKEYRSKGLTYNAPKKGLTYCGINVTNPLLKDARVREALFLAIDRDRFVNELREGFGDVSSQPWPKSSPAFDPALEGPHYDPARAKELLQQAGFSQSAPIPLSSRSPQYDNISSLLRENFEDIGVNVQIEPMEATAFTALLRQRGFKGLWATTHSYSNLAPVTNLEVTFPYRIPNLSYYESPEYLDVIDKLKTVDPLSDEAKAEYAKFNTLFTKDPWIVPIWGNSRIDLVGTKVRDFGSYYVTAVQWNKVWKA